MSESNTRVTSSDWKHHPMKQPGRAPWHADIPPKDLSNLLRGFRPQEMEDKWFCYAGDVDSQGDVLVHFCRSWTGFETVVLRVRVALDAAGAVDESAPAEVTEISWEQDQESARLGGEADVKQTAAILCEGILNCHLRVRE